LKLTRINRYEQKSVEKVDINLVYARASNELLERTMNVGNSSA